MMQDSNDMSSREGQVASGLTVATDAGTDRGRIARAFGHVPCWAIALVLVLLLQALRVFVLELPDWRYSRVVDYASMAVPLLAAGSVFVAGAIQRLDWRHALVMLGLLAVATGLSHLLRLVGAATALGYHLHRWSVGSLVTLALLGVGEMLTTRRRSWRVLLWVLAAAVAAEAFWEVARTSVNWMRWTFWLKIAPSCEKSLSVASLAYWPLFALVAWAFLPLGFAAARRGGHIARATAVVFALTVVLHTAFFHDLAFRLAESSLVGRGPFPRYMGVRLLAQRGKAGDLDLILRMLLEADWRHGPRTYLRPDWRSTGVAVLARDDATATEAAEALCRLLRRKRSCTLAAYTADLLLARRHYEAVPVLLRYALKPDPHAMPDECNKALERLGIPEAGLRILQTAYRYDRPSSRPADFDIDTESRRRLSALLSKDVGSRFSHWQAALTDAMERRPSTLPAAVQEEMDRELACYVKYVSASDRWYAARAAVARRRLAGEGKLHVLRAILQSRQQVDDGCVAEREVPFSITAAGSHLKACVDRVTDEMKVAPPDFDAPTVEAFEREVAAHAKRVDAVIAKHARDLTTTRPAESAPAATQGRRP